MGWGAEDRGAVGSVLRLGDVGAGGGRIVRGWGGCRGEDAVWERLMRCAFAVVSLLEGLAPRL
jgi:hypothetical protein